MAGRTLSVDMHDDDRLPAWQTVIEVAESGAASEWTLVGGLMVAAHARRAGVMMRRPTDDVDALVDYAGNRASLVDARSALARLGFELNRDDKFAYRFVHADGRKIDVMIADHLPSRMQPRLARMPAFAVPAGEQAIRRRDLYQLGFRSGKTVEIGVPDELGALVAKGAAFIVDSRDPQRHLDDSAVLLASIADASVLEYASASKNDRKRIKATTDLLADQTRASWASLDEPDRRRGQLNLLLIRRTLGIAAS
jgi:hypothetical protein